jgi:hypothetical protein
MGIQRRIYGSNLFGGSWDWRREAGEAVRRHDGALEVQDREGLELLQLGLQALQHPAMERIKCGKRLVVSSYDKMAANEIRAEMATRPRHC